MRVDALTYGTRFIGNSRAVFVLHRRRERSLASNRLTRIVSECTDTRIRFMRQGSNVQGSVTVQCEGAA